MRHSILAAFAAFMLAACADRATEVAEIPPSGGGSTGRFKLERTPCFGFCPVYKVTVLDTDKLYFEGVRYVARMEKGTVHAKDLPAGSFVRLIDIAKAHDFASFDEKYPNEDGSNCPNQATDLPGVIIAIESADLTHKVDFYQGCFDFEGRDRLEAMIAEMDAVLTLDDWIGAREDFMGGTKDGE